MYSKKEFELSAITILSYQFRICYRMLLSIVNQCHVAIVFIPLSTTVRLSVTLMGIMGMITRYEIQRTEVESKLDDLLTITRKLSLLDQSILSEKREILPVCVDCVLLLCCVCLADLVGVEGKPGGVGAGEVAGVETGEVVW